MEKHPFWKAQFGALGSIEGQTVDLSHMFVGKNEVVP